MWGIVPAAGRGTRLQPLAFSKELLPVGGALGEGRARPKAVSEHIVERMVLAGADKICFVIAPGKSDILDYYGAGRCAGVDLAFVVQPSPLGLCDAIFRALPVIARDEPIVVGLPDTIWFPERALTALPDDCLAFLLFPVSDPRHFDVVVTDEAGAVREIQVKPAEPASVWVWGAFKAPGAVLHDLAAFWRMRPQRDLYLGTLVTDWIRAGGRAIGVRAGRRYLDVGTLEGYRAALGLGLDAQTCGDGAA